MEGLFENLLLLLTLILAILLVFKNYSAYKDSTGATTTSFLFFLLLLIFVTALPILISILITFYIYRQLISLILTVKCGSKFGGLLGGNDATHTTNSATKAPVHFLFVIKYKENGQNFYDFAKEALNKIFLCKLSNIPKVFATLETFLGYSYLLKNEITLHDCLLKLKTLNCPTNEMTKADLMRLISEYSDVPLPKNRRVLWEILVGTQPVKWKKEVEEPGQKFYPIIFRFHHCLIDAVSFQKVILRLFADQENNNYFLITDDDLKKVSNCNSYSINEKFEEVTENYFMTTKHVFLKFVNRAFNKLKLSLHILHVICLAPSSFLVQAWFKRNDSNILYGLPLSNEKILSLNVEESPHYIEMIKRIKTNIQGSTFTDVFLTAITASLKEYYKKKSAEIPNYITVAIPTIREAVDVSHAAIDLLKDWKNQKMCCQNKTSLFIPTLPININNEDTNTPLIQRLRLIQAEGHLFRNSMDYEINYWFLRIFGTVLPKPIGQLIAELNNCTIGVSNLPGIHCVTPFENCFLQDMAFWLAHRELTGIGFSILSYSGRLQMGLIVDKALISSQEEVDGILNGVYKYLNLLDGEINCIEGRDSQQRLLTKEFNRTYLI